MGSTSSRQPVFREVHVLSAVALQVILQELAAKFEADTGTTVSLAFDTNPMIARRIEKREPFDVALINPHLMDGLKSRDLIIPPTKVNFGRSPMGIGVRAGHPPLDVSPISAFVHLLLTAQSIGYSSDGTSGRRFLEILGHLGIAEAVRTKLKPLEGGIAGHAVAAGQVELCIAPITTIMAAAPGVIVAGTLPVELDNQIEFAAAVGACVRDRPAADAFITFLTSPSLDAHLAAKGLERKRKLRQ